MRLTATGTFSDDTTRDVTSQVSWKSSAKKRGLGQDRPRSRDQDRRSRDGDGQQGPQGPERFGHRYGELSRRGRSDQEAEREELIGPPHQRRNPMRTVHPEDAVRSVLEAAARR
jgi:hypothetical protein